MRSAWEEGSISSVERRWRSKERNFYQAAKLLDTVGIKRKAADAAFLFMERLSWGDAVGGGGQYGNPLAQGLCAIFGDHDAVVGVLRREDNRGVGR